MSSCPLISIITVTYNAAKTIATTIDSITNQTYQNIEYIIVDGGSEDDTIDIIKKNKDKITQWISEPDKGIYDAMNKGLKMANGDWCIFMGGDDVFYNKQTIKNIVSHFTNKNNIYYGNVIMSTTKKIYPGYRISKFLICRRNICHQSIFYPKKIYKNYSYDLKYPIWADWVYNIKLFSLVPKNFIYINSIVSIFNDKGISNKGDVTFKKNRWRIINKYIGKKYCILLWIGYKTKQFIKNIKPQL